MKQIISEFLSDNFGYEEEVLVDALVEILEIEREEALADEYVAGRDSGLQEAQNEYDTGFSEGEISGYDSGYEDGYADGFVKGQESIAI